MRRAVVILSLLLICTLAACGTIQNSAPTIVTESSVSNTTPTTVPQETAIPETTVPETTVPTEPTHMHAYVSNIIYSTCTEGGYTTNTCECGHSYTSDVTEVRGHQWSDWKTVNTSNYFQKGSQQRTCHCGAEETRSTGYKTIENTGTITIPETTDLLSIISYPQEEDFPEYYENAVKLYEGLCAQTTEEVRLIFSEDTYELEWGEWIAFKQTFEKICLHGKGRVILLWRVTGAIPEGAGKTCILPNIAATIQLPALLSKACKDAGLYTGMSQFDAVKTLNEWMRGYFTYELEHYSIEKCLTTRKAQCAGYGKVFHALCDYVGMQAKYITGCAGHDGGPCTYECHAWNQVKLAGTWYYLDVCWNDSDSKPNRYFLTEKLWSERTVMTSSEIVN